MRKRRTGKVRAFFVGLVAYLVVGILGSFVVGLIAGLVVGLVDGSTDDESMESYLDPARALIFLLSIGIGVEAGRLYLRRYHPEPVSAPIHTDDGRPAMSELAHDDMRRTRDTALRLAESKLRLLGELIPFAVIVGSNGESSIPPFVAGGVKGLYQELRSRTAGLRCAAVVSPSGDGQTMIVNIEHREGPTVALRVPYSGQKRKIVLGTPEEQPGGVKQLWPEDAPH